MSLTREELSLPNNAERVLMHSCCAPCAVEIMQSLSDSGIHYTIYFYNPNIHPEKEYLLRKDENIRFAKKLGVPFIDADYDKDNWFARTKGHENDPERGQRCTLCFDMRFEKTALYAHENNFQVMSSTLGISRWKDMNQINDCGVNAAKPYPELTYWTYNWRKSGGSQRMIERSKDEEFYQQQYCGCAYSLRDTNRWRLKNDRKRITFGKDFYKKTKTFAEKP